jgi:hypothetical protein
MARFTALLAIVTAVVACSDEPTAPERVPSVYDELHRECLHDVVGGELVSTNWDELLVTFNCGEMMWELVQWGPTLTGLFGNVTFFGNIEPVRVVDGGLALTLFEHHRGIMMIGTGFPRVDFPHVLQDVHIIDLDGDGTNDYVTAGDDTIRRAIMNPVLGQHASIAAADMVELLPGKPYRYIAIADFGGSPLLDIFYVTEAGDLGVAFQTAPDTFDVLPLDRALGAPVSRPIAADVTGDGLADVVGAANQQLYVFDSATRRTALLDEPAHAIVTIDPDASGAHVPLVLAPDGRHIRRITIEPLASAPFLDLPIDLATDTMSTADLDGDRRSDLVLVHGRGTPTSWISTHRAITLPSE